MTLESTVICVDNSEYCRNGDYAPTRLLAQRDAINMVARSKLKQNAENTCALLTMANNGLAATLTSDSAKLHSVLSRVEPGGEMKVVFLYFPRFIFNTKNSLVRPCALPNSR